MTRRTESIALVISEPDERIFTDPFLAATLRGVSAGLSGTDLQLVLLFARPGEHPGQIARYLSSGHVDGVIVASHHQGDQLEQGLRAGQLPSVFVGRPFVDDGPRWVDVDNVEGGRIAARRLIDRGCRRIATITGPLDMTSGVDRLAGWRSEMQVAGLPDDAVVGGDFTLRGGTEATDRLLDEHPDVDAIFAASDLMAEGALRALDARGLSVPDDVAVVGFDDLGGAAATTPRLTTLRNPAVELVNAATSTLLALLAGEEVSPAPQIFKAELVEGESA